MIHSTTGPTYRETRHRIASNVSMEVTLLPRMTCLTRHGEHATGLHRMLRLEGNLRLYRWGVFVPGLSPRGHHQ